MRPTFVLKRNDGKLASFVDGLIGWTDEISEAKRHPSRYAAKQWAHRVNVLAQAVDVRSIQQRGSEEQVSSSELAT